MASGGGAAQSILIRDQKKERREGREEMKMVRKRREMKIRMSDRMDAGLGCRRSLTASKCIRSYKNRSDKL